MARKKMVTQNMNNKRMNKDVYKLRRKVMAFIYEAKTLVDIPRIDLRITDNDITDKGKYHTLGKARIKDNIIWIPEITIDNTDFDLRTIVFHELIHAIYGIDHDDKCPLMKTIYSKLTKATVHRLFKKYAKVI